MKARIDFVTNSSSTSYCIVGVPYDKVTIKANEYGDRDPHGAPKDEKIIFKCVNYECQENGVFGISIHDMKDDETLHKFKRRVIEALRRAFPDEQFSIEEIGIHVDGGYNG